MSSETFVHRLDKDGLRFLRAVEYIGGDASMTEIRQRTGLSRDVANHRFTRLEDLGLIEVSYADEGYGGRVPPKVAHLTGIARREIERGLFAPLRNEPEASEDVVDVTAELASIQNQISRHKQRLDAISSADSDMRGLETRIGSLENDLGTLERYVSQWDEEAEAYLIALKSIVQEDGVDFKSYLNDAREYIANITENK